MRISTNTLYSNFIFNQQTTYNDLNEVTNQLSSGMKIEKMADDPTIFTNTLRLDGESNSLKQVVATSQSAQTFANNTDTTMNEMTKTLESFKTKLLQSANGENSVTSYQALAGELKGLKNHLKQLANTSIDGKFLFSGTAFNTKPISDNGDYNGNDKNIKAKLGSQIETPYNIDGASLFQGIDSDYKKHISTNIKHFDILKQSPQFVVLKDGKYYIDKNITANNQKPATDDNSEKVSLSTNSQIRQLTGVDDVYNSTNDTYSDGTSYFYISGRKPSGETFSQKFSITNDSEISDLLEKIGKAFGNSASAKSVNVEMNQFGEIEITDTTTGKMVTDFNLIASDADRNSIDDLVKNGDYVVSFIKSDFPPQRDISNLSAQNKNFDNRVFTLNSEFRKIENGDFAKKTDTVFDILGTKGLNKANSPVTRDNLKNIRFTGTDTNGNSVDTTLNITSSTTMQSIVNTIKNNFGDVEVSLDNGKLNIYDNTIDKNGSSNISLNINARNSSNESLSMFSRMDGITNDKTAFNIDGKLVTSNIPQIDKNTQLYATDNTKLIDVSGNDDIDGKKIDINYTDKDGNIKRAYITLKDNEWTDGSGNKHFSTFTTISDSGTEKIYDIFDNEGNKTPIHDKTTITQQLDPETCKLCNVTHTTKGISYKQLNDVIGMLVSGNLPTDGTKNSDYKTAISNSKEYVNVGLKDGKLFIEDRKNSETDIKFKMYDDDTDSYSTTSSKNPSFAFNSNNALVIDEPKVDIFHQLDEIIKAVENGKARMDGDEENPRNRGIQADIELIDHLQDHIIKKHTEIGAISKSLQNTEERNNMLIVHVETLKSSVIDVDMAEASLELQKLTLNYKAMLSTISKVNSLSLVNYMK